MKTLKGKLTLTTGTDEYWLELSDTDFIRVHFPVGETAQPEMLNREVSIQGGMTDRGMLAAKVSDNLRGDV